MHLKCYHKRHCRLSVKPTSSTLLAPCSSIVQPVDGTNLIPVWSQFRIISSGGISSISTVTLNSSKNSFFFSTELVSDICSLLLFPSSGHNSFKGEGNVPNVYSNPHDLQIHLVLFCPVTSKYNELQLSPPGWKHFHQLLRSSLSNL